MAMRTTFLAAAVAAVRLADSSAPQYQVECHTFLRELEGRDSGELAALCRARLPGEVCRNARKMLGAQPWRSESLEATCKQWEAEWLPRALKMDDSTQDKAKMMAMSQVPMDGTAEDKPPTMLPSGLMGGMMGQKEKKEKKSGPFGDMLGLKEEKKPDPFNPLGGLMKQGKHDSELGLMKAMTKPEKKQKKQPFGMPTSIFGPHRRELETQTLSDAKDSESVRQVGSSQVVQKFSTLSLCMVGAIVISAASGVVFMASRIQRGCDSRDMVFSARGLLEVDDDDADPESEALMAETRCPE